MQTLREAINERSTRQLTIPFLDAAGVPLAGDPVVTLTASLRDLDSDTLIRTAENVNGANGGTVSGGILTLVLNPTDTQISNSHTDKRRLLTLDLLTAGGVRITEQVEFVVKALRDIS